MITGIILMAVVLISLAFIFLLSRILDADVFETVLVALIIVGSVAVLAIIFYLVLLIWRCLI